MPVTLTTAQCGQVIGIARGFVADRSDAAAVTRAADVLIGWAQQAADERDLENRLRALREQSEGCGDSRSLRGDAVAFTRHAQAYYAFYAKAGSTQVLS